MDMAVDSFIIAILQIIAIDIILGGDNAIVIAMACRNLPEHQKRAGILWGTAGAILLRIILVFFATSLMGIPSLRLIGGILLVWIGIKLLIENDEPDLEGKIAKKTRLIDAVRTIVVADFVMSLDNALAITAAAKGNMSLVIFGVALSVPIIIAGSAIILRMMDRFPVIISFGAGLLGWLGGGLISSDVIIADFVDDLTSSKPFIIELLTGIFVVLAGNYWKFRTRSESRTGKS